LRPCSYLFVEDGIATCTAMLMKDPPPKVANYLKRACFPWPTKRYAEPPYPGCGFYWERVDGG
jgi:hypothetical protein